MVQVAPRMVTVELERLLRCCPRLAYTGAMLVRHCRWYRAYSTRGCPWQPTERVSNNCAYNLVTYWRYHCVTPLGR